MHHVVKEFMTEIDGKFRFFKVHIIKTIENIYYHYTHRTKQMKEQG